MQNTGKTNQTRIAHVMNSSGEQQLSRRKRRCVQISDEPSLSPERRRSLSLTLRDALNRAKIASASVTAVGMVTSNNATKTTTQQQLPLEVMAMIAATFQTPGEAHSLSLASKDWNLAFRVAFPRVMSPRFIMYAIYENPECLAEVPVILDDHVMLALCATVKNPVHLERLAKPGTQELYNKCVKHATRYLNREALATLLTYGQERDSDTQGGWALLACIETISVFVRSGEENARMVFYETVYSHGGPFIANEVVRATAFRRVIVGIRCILNVASSSAGVTGPFNSLENVRLLLSTVATMSSQPLLLQMLSTYPLQIAQIMASADNREMMEMLARSGWTEAADALLALMAEHDTPRDPETLLRYAVITGQTTLVKELLFPRRRSTRRRKRSLDHHHHHQSLGGGDGGRLEPVTMTDDGIIREAVLLGHEDIATLLCTAAPYLVTMSVVCAAVRAGYRAEFVAYLLKHVDVRAQSLESDGLAKTAINFKNYEVVALLVTEYSHLAYTRETLLSALNLLGPFRVYAPAVSTMLHSPAFRALL